MGKAPRYTQVYAVIRYDGYLEEFADDRPPIKVKEIVHDLETAEREMARLNALRQDDAWLYWWQATQLHPPGTAAGSEGEAAESS